MDDQLVSRIASQLYEGILSPPDWYNGMESLNRALGGAKFHQIVADRQQGTVLDSLASADDGEAASLYERHYAWGDERLAILMGLGQGQMMLDHEHFSARDMSRSAIYADWLASHGLKHTMALMLCIDGPVHDCVALMRHADQQPFGHAERCLALRLMPDLVRTTRLRSRMSAMATTAALGLAALNALPQGVVVLAQYLLDSDDHLLDLHGASL